MEAYEKAAPSNWSDASDKESAAVAKSMATLYDSSKVHAQMVAKMMCVFAIQYAIKKAGTVNNTWPAYAAFFPPREALRKRALPLAEDIKPPEGESHAITSGASFPWSVVQLHFASQKQSSSPPASEGSSSRASSPAMGDEDSEEESPPETSDLLNTEMLYTRAQVGKIHLLHYEKTLKDPPGWKRAHCSSQIKDANAMLCSALEGSRLGTLSFCEKCTTHWPAGLEKLVCF